MGAAAWIQQKGRCNVRVKREMWLDKYSDTKLEVVTEVPLYILYTKVGQMSPSKAEVMYFCIWTS